MRDKGTEVKKKGEGLRQSDDMKRKQARVVCI